MTPRLSVLAVVAVCLLACGEKAAPYERFSDTKTEVTLGTSKGYFGGGWSESDDITVDFSGDAVSFVGYFEANITTPPKKLLAFVSYVEGPGGVVLFDASWFKTFGEANLHLRPVNSDPLGTDGTASIHWPISDDLEMERGKYILRVAVASGDDSRATADGGTNDGTTPDETELTGTFHTVIRRGERTGSGTLDVNLFYVDGSGFKTTDDAPVQSAFETFFADLDQFGIKRGQVATFDITTPNLAEIDTDDETSKSPMHLLQREAKRAPNKRAANIFFVKELQSSSLPGGLALGLSDGIPVALGIGESNHSGVMIATSLHYVEATSSYDTALMGHVMSHEVGHSIGLFHTTEQTAKERGRHDPLPDTPECPGYADIDKDDILESRECVDFDATNIMFWQAGFQSILSPSQGYVYRHSVIVQGEPTDQ